jgi:aminopeptidase
MAVGATALKEANMHDPRLTRLTRLILHHSMQIKKGDCFSIASDTCAKPLVKALLAEAARIGALARVEWTDTEISRLLLELYNPDDGGVTAAYLEDKAACNMRLFQNLTGEIVIRAYVNDAELSQIDPKIRQLDAAKAKPFRDLVINHRRWVLFEYPTPARAQRAGLPFDQYTDFVLDTAALDYAAMQRQAAPLKALMEKTDKVRIIGPETDLAFSVRGIPAVPCCGEYNLPDGECFTAPVRDSVNGHIKFNTPSLFWGTLFHNIQLTFSQGRIVQASAEQNEDKLRQILDTDDGARCIGEFAIGFNPLILEPSCNTLFDEKIAGSFHLTPGACYDEAPNGNESAIHWDLVNIQRPDYGGGEIWFDGLLVRKDGLFTLPELTALNP